MSADDYTEELIKEFPILLKDARIEHPPGWHQPIKAACQELWDLYLAHQDEFAEPLTLGQTKEKFGGCRFYLGTMHLKSNDEQTSRAMWEKVNAISDACEKKCHTMCQNCGTVPSVVSANQSGSWLANYCTVCAEKSGYHPLSPDEP